MPPPIKQGEVKLLQAVAAFGGLVEIVESKPRMHSTEMHAVQLEVYPKHAYSVLFALELLSPQDLQVECPSYTLQEEGKRRVGTVLHRYSIMLHEEKALELIPGYRHLNSGRMMSSTSVVGSEFTGRSLFDKAKEVQGDLVHYTALWHSFLKDNGDFYSGENHDVVLQKVFAKLFKMEQQKDAASRAAVAATSAAAAPAVPAAPLASMDRLAALREEVRGEALPDSASIPHGWSPGSAWVAFIVFGPFCGKHKLPPAPVLQPELRVPERGIEGRSSQRKNVREAEADARAHSQLESRSSAALMNARSATDAMDLKRKREESRARQINDYEKSMLLRSLQNLIEMKMAHANSPAVAPYPARCEKVWQEINQLGGKVAEVLATFDVFVPTDVVSIEDDVEEDEGQRESPRATTSSISCGTNSRTSAASSASGISAVRTLTTRSSATSARNPACDEGGVSNKT